MVQDPEAANWKKQVALKKQLNAQERKHLCRSLFDKVADPEACDFLKNRLQYSCFPVNFATFLKTCLFYGTTPVAATDYFELYNLVSNSNNTSFAKENYPNFRRIQLICIFP